MSRRRTGGAGPRVEHHGWGRVVRHARGIVGLLILGVVLIGALGAPVLAPEPDEQDLLNRLKPPGWQGSRGQVHVLGTDELGRDVLARVLHGSRTSLLIGFLSVMLAGAVGTALGVTAGHYRGATEKVIMRIVDIQMSFPPLVMAIAVVTVLKPGLGSVILTLGVVGWVVYTRIVRAEVLKLREMEFMLAARALGATDSYIIVRYIVPHVLVSVLVVASFAAAQMIIAESSLSFLGLGLPAGVPTWGNMISDARNVLSKGWWLAAMPGGALLLTLLALNFVGDWLRDVLDPTLQL